MSPAFSSIGSTLVAAEPFISERTGTTEIADGQLPIDADVERPPTLPDKLYDEMELDDAPSSSSSDEPWLCNFRIRGLLKEDRYAEALVRFSFGPTDIGSLQGLLDLISEKERDMMEALTLSMADLVRVEGYSSFRSEVRYEDADFVECCNAGVVENEEAIEERWREFFKRAWEDEMDVEGYEADDEKENTHSCEGILRRADTEWAQRVIEVKVTLFFCDGGWADGLL